MITFTYKLTAIAPLDTTVEGLAHALDDAARQLREMSSVNAAHSMELATAAGVKVVHGVAFVERAPRGGLPEPGACDYPSDH